MARNLSYESIRWVTGAFRGNMLSPRSVRAGSGLLGGVSVGPIGRMGCPKLDRDISESSAVGISIIRESVRQPPAGLTRPQAGDREAHRPTREASLRRQTRSAAQWSA